MSSLQKAKIVTRCAHRVLQGSVLGPLWVFFYINDKALEKFFSHCKLNNRTCLFADEFGNVSVISIDKIYSRYANIHLIIYIYIF